MDALTIPAAPLEVGEHVFALLDLPAECRGVKVTVSRDALPEGDLALVTIEARRSPADPWQMAAQGTLPGGTIMTPRKTVADRSELEFRWPEENDGQGGVRVVRGSDARVRVDVLQPFTAAISVKAT